MGTIPRAAPIGPTIARLFPYLPKKNVEALVPPGINLSPIVVEEGVQSALVDRINPFAMLYQILDDGGRKLSLAPFLQVDDQHPRR